MERDEFTKLERLVFDLIWLSVSFALVSFAAWLVAHT
jgi:hypothetical protein